MAKNRIIKGKTKRHMALDARVRNEGLIARYYVVDNNTVALLISIEGVEIVAKGIALYSPLEQSRDNWVRTSGQEVALGRAFKVVDGEEEEGFPIVPRTLLVTGWDSRNMRPTTVGHGKHLKRAFETFGGLKASCPTQLNEKESSILDQVRVRLAERNEATS